MGRGAFIACLAACAVGWAALLAAPGQQSPATARPGEPTKPLVWVENRTDAEAIPVSLRDASLAAPLPVILSGTSSVALAPSSVAQVRVARQPWEYRQVVVAAGQDAAAALAPAGEEGWEVTGVHGAVPGGTAVLLKRPR